MQTVVTTLTLTSVLLWKARQLSECSRDIQWNPFSSARLNTLFIEQMATVKALLAFCSIKETFLKFYIYALLPCWAIFMGFSFWIFTTSMQSCMLFSKLELLFYVSVCHLVPLFLYSFIFLLSCHMLWPLGVSQGNDKRSSQGYQFNDNLLTETLSGLTALLYYGTAAA